MNDAWQQQDQQEQEQVLTSIIEECREAVGAKGDLYAAILYNELRLPNPKQHKQAA